ncbi:hypothetical protein YC2023_101183 [Brassica napus]
MARYDLKILNRIGKGFHVFSTMLTDWMRSPIRHLSNIRFRMPLMIQKRLSTLLSRVSDVRDVGELSKDLHLFGSNCCGMFVSKKDVL